MAWVGAVITVSGRRTPGTTVLVTIGFDGGEAFGEDSEAGKSTWSITAACPDEEGDNVPIIASVGSDVVVKTIGRVLLAATPWTAGMGQTLVSGKLEQWAAQDGVHVATQATASKQFTVGTDAAGAYVEVAANGVMNCTTLGPAFGNGVTETWAAAVIDVANLAAIRGVFSWGPENGTYEGCLFLDGTEQAYARWNGGTEAVNSGALSLGRHLLIWQASGGTGYLYVDGSLAASTALSGSLDLAALTLLIGALRNTSYDLSGKLRTIAFGTTMTTPQRQRLEAALKSEWGTP
jgi:hypothetical protein